MEPSTVQWAFSQLTFEGHIPTETSTIGLLTFRLPVSVRGEKVAAFGYVDVMHLYILVHCNILFGD